MNAVIKEWGPLAGRILIGLLFLPAGISKIPGWENTAGYMASKGVPLVALALVITIVVEIVAAAMVIVGYKARIGAAALFLWLIPVTFMMHDFWNIADAGQKMIQMIMFNKNVALMGTMLLIMAFGSGPRSLDKGA
jgi:putative oxidoreductase